MDLESLYKKMPHTVQNIFVTGYNIKKNRKRHGGKYNYWKSYFLQNEFKTYSELKKLQTSRLRCFLEYAISHSEFYKKSLNNIDVRTFEIEDLKKLPIFSKEDIRSNLDEIYTIPKSKSNISRTGGTTGKSLEVRFDWNDIQERKALLDIFRTRFGYKKNCKTGWFSGKSIIDTRDIKNNRYWKSDLLTNVDYYSTFHIHKDSAKYYLNHINKVKPKILVGFPSSMAELAKHGLSQNINLEFNVTAIFPTAETLVKEESDLLLNYFGGPCKNQYASSEGASFIIECEKGKLHYEMLSGVIEVIDDYGNHSDEGRMLITSFSTRGTPLIRYDIGDSMTLENIACDCGRNTPVVKQINGRINDFIYSEETGKCNLGNISNCVKYVVGIIKFQVVQEELDAIKVLAVVDNTYKTESENSFRNELVDRLGKNMKIEFIYVTDIPKTKIGKHQIVLNKVKHLIR